MNARLGATPSRLIAGWIALSCLIVAFGGILAAHAADTLYVDNTRACPGGPGTVPESAFCRVDSALNSFVGGANRVIALMGQGKPYTEQIKVFPSDSGSVAQPLVLFARGAVTIEGADTTIAWTARPADSASIVILWAAPVPAAPSFACRQVIMRHSVTNIDRRYPELDTVLTAIPVGKSHYDAAKDTVFVNFDEPSRNYAGALYSTQTTTSSATTSHG